jgi:hypothetical protein
MVSPFSLFFTAELTDEPEAHAPLEQNTQRALRFLCDLCGYFLTYSSLHYQKPSN